MLAKISSRNQITIPKKLMEQLPETKYFNVEYRDGVIVLKPVQVVESDLERIRAKIKKAGLGPDSVAEAIRWARSR